MGILLSVGLHKETVCTVVTLDRFTVLSTDNSYLMKCIHTVHFFLHYAIRINTFSTISFCKPGFFQFNLEIMMCSYTNRVCTGRYLWLFFLYFSYFLYTEICNQSRFWYKLTILLLNCLCSLSTSSCFIMETARIIPLSTFPRNHQLNKKTQTRKNKWNIVLT